MTRRATYSTAWMHLHIALIRFGWVKACIWVLCLAGVSSLVSFSYYKEVKLAVQQRELNDLKLSSELLQAPEPVQIIPASQQRIKDFYQTLGDSKYTQERIKILYELAKANGLNLNQVEHKTSHNHVSLVYSHEVLFPVKGSYESIRQFCRQSLLVLPHTSLDQISFRREAIGNQAVETKLRFTFYSTEASYLTAIAAMPVKLKEAK